MVSSVNSTVLLVIAVVAVIALAFPLVGQSFSCSFPFYGFGTACAEGARITEHTAHYIKLSKSELLCNERTVHKAGKSSPHTLPFLLDSALTGSVLYSL